MIIRSIKKRSFLLFLLMVGYIGFLKGQSAHFINNGAKVITTSGVTLYTQGEVSNQVNGANIGEITNDGTIHTQHTNSANAAFVNRDPNSTVQGNGFYEVYGDWVNNGIFFGGTSEAILFGPDQLITGDSITTFNDLTLTGTGTKTQTLNSEVTGILDLTDRELHTDTNTMFVLNPAPGAVTRAGGMSNVVEGFVSSDSTGWFYREMNQASNYLFPVGDSITTPRFRPFNVTPTTTNAHAYRARFKNSNPTPDGYDVLTKQAGIGPVNDKFYWRLDRQQGSDPADLQFFYDSAVDSADMAVHWETQWELMGVGTNTMNSSPTLSSVGHTGWNDFSPQPFNIAANPFQVNAGPDDTICFEDSVQLNASTIGGTGPFSYNWSPGTMVDDSTIQNPWTQGLTDTTTFIVTAYDSATNTTSLPDTVTIFVKPYPTVSVTPNNPTTCPGDSALMVASGANTYSWIPNYELNTNTGDSVYASPANDTTYTVVGTDIVGCTDSVDITVSVDSAPGEPFADVTPDTICVGDSAVITATGSGSNVTYEVYDSASGGNYLGDTPLAVYPVNDSAFYVEATLSGSGCTYPGGRDTVQVAVVSSPTSPTLSLSPDTICVGDSSTLTATGSGPGVTYEVYDSLTGGNYLGNAPLDVSPNSTETYYVEAINSNGCDQATGRDSISLVVNPLPVIAPGPSNPAVCPGDSIQLFASGASSYTWSPSTALNTTTGDTVISNPSSDITYTVSGTDSNGCSNDTSITVSVDSVPTAPTVDITPDTICQGDSATITASGSGSNVVYEVYDSDSAGTYIGDAPLNVGPMSDTTYYIEATLSGGGCSYPGGRDSVKLVVNGAPPAPTVSVNNDTVCAGDSTTINASGSGAGITYEVYDSLSGGNYLGDAPLTVTPSTTTTYYVSAVNSNGCDQATGRDSASVVVQPIPQPGLGTDTIGCPGDTITLTASGGGSYNWSTGATTSSINVVVSGDSTYGVMVTAPNGCTNADTIQVNAFSSNSLMANDDSATVDGGDPFTVEVFANDSGAFTDSVIVSGPYLGTAVWNSVGIEYTGPEGENTTDSLTYSICSAICPTVCDTAMVNLNIESIDELFIPDGVSANGDGYNDKFVISGLQAYPDNSLRIFNRWGELVYSAQPYENDWEGQVNEGFAGGSGGTVPDGTYFYILDLGPDKEKIKGYIEFVK